MTLPLIALAIVLLWLPRLVHPLGRRLAPGDWSVSSRRSLIAGAVALALSVLGLTLPTISGALGKPMLARWCDELLSHLPHGAPYTGWIAAVLIGVSLVWGLLGYRRSRRVLQRLYVDSHVGNHYSWEGTDVVVLPISEPVAYSRLRPIPQIVLSQGLVESLDDVELELLLLHERTHLQKKDENTLIVLSVLQEALRWLPGVRESVLVAKVAIERLADEAAAGIEPPRRQALSSALIKTATWKAPVALAAFCSVSGIAERVHAMEGRVPPLPLRQRVWLLRVTSVLRFSGTTGATAGFLLLVGVCSA